MEQNELTPSIQIPTDLLPKIPMLRREYGDLSLYQLGDTVIAYRPLTVAEFVDVTEIARHDSIEAEDMALAKAIVYPDNALDLIDEAPAGAVELLVQDIMRSSNMSSFQDLQSGMARARAEAQSAESAMVAWICAAFPGFKPKDVYNLSQVQMLRHVALAELILQRPLEFEDPNAKQRKKDGKKRGFGMMTPPVEAPVKASEMMESLQKEPRRLEPGPVMPGTASPVQFDFDSENRLMGYGGG